MLSVYNTIWDPYQSCRKQAVRGCSHSSSFLPGRQRSAPQRWRPVRCE